MTLPQSYVGIVSKIQKDQESHVITFLPEFVCKLKKSQYGLRQALRQLSFLLHLFVIILYNRSRL